MPFTDTINIFGVNINKLNENSFLQYIKEGISKSKKITIGYANADTLNKIYSDKDLKKIYSTFDLIHPDGAGIYLASRILYGNNGFENRLTGSDFYPLLINESIKNNWKYFFFGHDNNILSGISDKYPELNISGLNEGYNFNDKEVIQKINLAKPDIIIIGLSCPKQEKWIFENKSKLDFKVIIAVGDGIKVFAGKKLRGPVIFQKAGLEWITRLIMNPVTNFNKYIKGIPFFLSRILKEKVKK